MKENFNFSTENFFEPTEKYKNEWFDVEDVKSQFNCDIISFVTQYKWALELDDVAKFIKVYDFYRELYDFDDIEIYMSVFGNYPQSDFNLLCKYCFAKK